MLHGNRPGVTRLRKHAVRSYVDGCRKAIFVLILVDVVRNPARCRESSSPQIVHVRQTPSALHRLTELHWLAPPLVLRVNRHRARNGQTCAGIGMPRAWLQDRESAAGLMPHAHPQSNRIGRRQPDVAFLHCDKSALQCCLCGAHNS